MKIITPPLAGTLVGALFLVASVAIAFSAEQFDNSWINGKWEGQPPAGGVLTMTLSVDKDNQIHGAGIIPVRGGTEGRPDISGTVKGKQVVLETFFFGSSGAKQGAL